MKAVVQRVIKASVTVNDGNTIKEDIGKGAVVFLGIGKNDSQKDIICLTDKIVNLRIFPDGQDKMNYSLLDIKGEILIVSQFTLYGDCSKGRRPDFTSAALPGEAEDLYNRFVFVLKQSNLKVKTGKFAADMLVEIFNDGPVTLILETKS